MYMDQKSTGDVFPPTFASKVRATTWLRACNREDLNNNLHVLHKTARLCEDHFDPKMFIIKTKRVFLTATAVPTIFPSLEGSSRDFDHTYSKVVSVISNTNEARRIKVLQHIVIPSAEQTMTSDQQDNLPCSSPLGSPNEMEHVDNFRCVSSVSMASSSVLSDSLMLSPRSTQTTSELSSKTPRKEKYRNKIIQLKREIDSLKNKNLELEKKREAGEDITFEQYCQLTHKFCGNDDMAEFINFEVSQAKKKPFGRRYSVHFKMECLPLYFAGPKLYKQMLCCQWRLMVLLGLSPRLIPSTKDCRTHRVPMVIYYDGEDGNGRFKCKKACCKQGHAVSKNTWFENAHLKPHEVAWVMYGFAQDWPH
ncbi:unnamed protein product [Phyllotreta striolata]|uniref:THAP-type domain-containing protein n=1 Tax=Phyllotreta striolata TaxID=444603 RepID=A0A9N9TJB2_PHYSR|nr:unnamed protein product [Phyllotreta striolata]